LAIEAGLDPVVEDTGRTSDEQAGKVALGVSWTRNSLHCLKPPEQKARAIDMCRGLPEPEILGWNGTVGTAIGDGAS